MSYTRHVVLLVLVELLDTLRVVVATLQLTWVLNPHGGLGNSLLDGVCHARKDLHDIKPACQLL